MNRNTNFKRAASLLAGEINKQRLVVFLGAGCSIAAGLPSWNELINSLLEKHNIKTRVTDLVRLASRLENKIGSLKFREEVAHKMRIRPNISTTIHDTLVSLDVNLFITTNYDHLLEDCFRKNGFSPIVITNDQDIPGIDPTQKTIVKLHGDIDSYSSLVITSKDYTHYKSRSTGFVEWLNMIFSQNTVLFLGTSFDDPRLKEMDEHILNLFKSNRRQPFILLKMPVREKNTSVEDYQVELDDFNALCESFEEKDFYVVKINQYDEIVTFLKKLQQRALDMKIKEDPSRFGTKLSIHSDYTDILEKSLSKEIDEKILERCEQVRGRGRLPTVSIMLEHAEQLIQYVNDRIQIISPNSQMEAFLTIADALLNSNLNKEIVKAREYYERANQVFHNISNQDKWKERLSRVRAKLLFFEGKTDEAINSLSHSDDNKTISIWLALLLDTGRFDEAYRFVSRQKLHPFWVLEALYVFVILGHIQEAEKTFQQTKDEYESVKKSKKLKESPFKGTFFYEKICYVMADALYQRALRLSSKPGASLVLPGDLTDESARLCRDALKYVDLLFKQESRQNIKENHVAFLATRIELGASHLLKKWQRANNAATLLLPVKPVGIDVANYIVGRIGGHDKHFPKTFFEYFIARLIEDQPESSWAYLRIAAIEGLHFKKTDEAWQALQRAIDLAVSLDEKVEVAQFALDLGEAFNRLDDSFLIINEILLTKDIRKQFLEARYYHLKGKQEIAEQRFNKIEKGNPPPDMMAEILFMKAENAIANESWEVAKKLLEDSKNLVLHPMTLMELLKVLTKLGNDAEALEISEQLEKLGIEDAQVIHIKAHTARNLGQYTKSEKAWRHLRKKYPQKPEFAYGLAEILFLTNKPIEEAVDPLNSFIDCKKKVDLNCLAIACSMYEANERFDTAFQLLENCHTQIENDPRLLFMHLDLGFRTGNEEKAHRSLSRIDVLRQEGKVPEDAFSRVPFDQDQILELFKKRKESFEKLNDLYRLGRIPRIFLCEQHNMPLYLDWAVRRQELTLPSDPANWINYTTYSTNSLRVDFAHGRNQLVPIILPKDVKEIVIDYHALITIHRLGLFDKLEERFSKIYYPHVLNVIFANDQKRYGHHQRTREESYRNLNEKIENGRLREIIAPELKTETETISVRDLSLARLENIPLIDNYIEQEEINAFPEVSVIRLPQLVEWLYARGKIGENQFKELSTILKGNSYIVTDDVMNVLDNTYKFLISEITLELMEQYGIVKVLLDMGIQVIIERVTANIIRNAVRDLVFWQKVGNWHKELSKAVKNLKSFEEVHPQIKPQNKIIIQNPYDEAAISSFEFAKLKDLFLLTDDRWTQMIRENNYTNKQFGTDVLLLDLYEKGLISTEEYTNYFLQLCQWRYRFLIPDERILLFLAKEYRNNPLGEPLMTIASYGRTCMEDRGLFLGLEQTDPPFPLGIKFLLTWIGKWVDMLIAVWQDDDFTSDSCSQITQKVYLQALPSLPSTITNDIRKNFYNLVDIRNIIMQILISSFTVEDPYKLHGLMKHTFDIFGYDEKRRIVELKNYLESLSETLGRQSKNDLRVVSIRALKVFYGENIVKQSIAPLLLPILVRAGVIKNKHEAISLKNRDEKPNEYTLKEIAKLITQKRSIPEYLPPGPLILIPPTKEKGGISLSPHDLICAPSKAVRIEAIKKIQESNDVTDFTKAYINQNKENIISGGPVFWHPIAAEAAHNLLSDFRYSRALFQQAMKLPSPDHKQIDGAWKYVMEPSIASVMDEMPALLNAQLTEATLLDRVESDLFEEKTKVDETYTDLLKKMLDWYLKTVYFIPVSTPLNPWNIISKSLNLASEDGITSKTVKHTLKEWISDNKDPLTYLVALDIVVNIIRSTDRDDESSLTQSESHKFLNELLEMLMVFDQKDAKEIVEIYDKKAYIAWQLRTALSRYYLKYIDLHGKEIDSDEQRVGLAWWMGREVSNSLLNSCSHLNLSDQIAWLEEEVAVAIHEKERSMHIRHLFDEGKDFSSIHRYQTLYSSALITSAIMANFVSQESKDNVKSETLKVISAPTVKLSTKFRDTIIERTAIQTLMGNGQLESKANGKLPVLWNTSLCFSVPAFLKAYYGDAIDFLGEEKRGILNFAEYASQSDFLDKELKNIPQYMKAEKLYFVSTLLTSLKISLFVKNKIPKGFKVFKENIMMAQELSQIDNEWGDVSLATLGQIMGHLYRTENLEWVSVIANLFKRIDYSKCSENTINIIVPEIITLVLIGIDYEIFEPILNNKLLDKRIRNILGMVKPWIKFAFPRVTGLNRENIRTVLRDLEDIPIVQGEIKLRRKGTANDQ